MADDLGALRRVTLPGIRAVVALLPATGGAADAGGRHYDDVGSETASEVAVQNRAHAVSRTSQLRKSSSTVRPSSGARVVPAAASREAADKNRRRRGLEGTFFVDVVARIVDVDALDASLRPEKRLVDINRYVRPARYRIAVRLRRRLRVKLNALPVGSAVNGFSGSRGFPSAARSSASRFLKSR